MNDSVAPVAERHEVFREVVRGITVHVMDGEEVSGSADTAGVMVSIEDSQACLLPSGEAVFQASPYHDPVLAAKEAPLPHL